MVIFERQFDYDVKYYQQKTKRVLTKKDENSVDYLENFIKNIYLLCCIGFKINVYFEILLVEFIKRGNDGR